MAAKPDLRMEALRLVLLLLAVGHLVTTVQFLFWPGYFLTGEPPVPPWPLSAFQFGDWPPLHAGFMNVVAMYDLAVAAGLLWTMRDPSHNKGFLFFAIVLFVGHGAIHAYHIVWGDSPAHYWVATTELWVGAAIIGVLWPRDHATGPPATGRTRVIPG